MSKLTEEQVTEYLRNHPEFLLNWLGENSSTELVDVFGRLARDRGVDSSVPDTSVGTCRSDTRSSLPNFTQVSRNSITSSIFRRYVDGDRTRKTSLRKDRNSLRTMSEDELFMELIRDIASELDVNLLCHKILQNVSLLTNSDRSSLFLVRGSREGKYLVSKLFDVTVTSTLEDSQNNEIKVPFGKGIVGIVAQTGVAINIKDAYADPRFNQEIDRQTGYKTHSILSMPIVNYEGEVIGVAQIINKIDGDHEFTKQDEEVFRKYLIFCGIGITNAQLFEMSVNEFKRNKLLLHLARGIFEEQTNLEKLVQKIMLDAQDLLKCERCSVYLLEDTLEHDIARFTHAFMSRLGTYSRSSLVMAMQSTQVKLHNIRKNIYQVLDPANQHDMTANLSLGLLPEAKQRIREEVVFSKGFDMWSKDGNVTAISGPELSTSRTAFIAKFAVITDETVNVPDVEADGRFGKGPFVDLKGCTIRSVLCMPIHNSDKQIIGVTQLVNKTNGEPFNDNDVNIIEAFSIFTGLGIHNCQMYENACQLMAKQSVALEVLSYHATAQTEESNELARSDIPSAAELQLYSFDFDDMQMGDDVTLKACIRMFMEADLINRFKVPYEVACRWVCTVKKNYRPVTYHNWRHAFNVCQTMFNIIFTGGFRTMFDDLEVFSLMAACLCHDLDHRGTNNAFQAKVASPLAMLYSTSVLEHHHFDHCIMILNSEGNNIFQSLSPEEYRRAIRMLEHAILSTDLAIYFKTRGDFKKLVENGERTFREKKERELLRAMMMTACDVAAITKPWIIQQKVAQLVTNEFFEQGDIERTQLGEQPIPMMDRNKKDELPKMQVGFIDAVCIPVYKLFAEMNERLAPLYLGCENNREKWQELADEKTTSLATETEQTNQEQPASDRSSEQTNNKSNNIDNNNTNGRDKSVNERQASHQTTVTNLAADSIHPLGKPDLDSPLLPSTSTLNHTTPSSLSAPTAAHPGQMPSQDERSAARDTAHIVKPLGADKEPQNLPDRHGSSQPGKRQQQNGSGLPSKPKVLDRRRKPPFP
ncbi:cGMP-specific 3',5'-cyclic phosphodiesterase-like isoform X1 [Pomacea canaliculata]|uniref:cGMP-specific 3',5'-cyclic phosphodiesterase-like isoform X1 n=1 Tax=Pomacea canaliculata TaxID=400727 RepID=UPI000D73F683|nr:cGMP-specific 3',5'-cyclic phosphodiesterase-like isoform X1 [Pomacea canaliculata]XP_025093158.1 cGMP-specific 3',5'-cyclic phosphodiesterase-like isoform X1 [Pomacea canaliculata]XP_025093159.1 cGMP-specific 3',5'-cyclic phosphodiesterase-like isoform X1 [Pomacea canaliculata]XP_025093160.1 cGMP-specific 3',5'-cyclic phosphodiesterase-like isoform X1 [Pomacea canaliculata]